MDRQTRLFWSFTTLSLIISITFVQPIGAEYADSRHLSSIHQHVLTRPGDFTRNPIPAEGKVRTYGIMDNTMASQYLNAGWHDWFVERYDAMQVYSPWFDTDTAWYANGFEYKDLYAIYDCTQATTPSSSPVSPTSPNSICASANTEHLALYNAAMDAEEDTSEPDWLLKDDEGNRLYIPTTDAFGRHTQFAADVRTPAFRGFWIEQMHSALTRGSYEGLFVDDVNMDMNRALSNGECRPADFPYEPDCVWETDIEPSAWSGHVVTFVQEIRDAFPNHTIIHNSVWFQAPIGHKHTDAQIQAADIITFERGLNDRGIIGGNGPTSVSAFFNYNDDVHNAGRDVLHYLHVFGFETLGVLAELKQMEYGLAGWLLISEGGDYIGSSRYDDPMNWWEGFEVNLGPASSDRHQLTPGVFRRTFEHGVVLLNEPASSASEAPAHIDLLGLYKTLNNECIEHVVLPPRTGKILFAVDACTQAAGFTH